jgi:hypothetical protein
MPDGWSFEKGAFWGTVSTQTLNIISDFASGVRGFCL